MSDDDRNSMGGFNNSPANGLGHSNAGTQWKAGVNVNDNPLSAQIKVGIYNDQQQQEAYNSRRRKNGGSGYYEHSSGPSALSTNLLEFFSSIFKGIKFLLKVMFYYMPKYHTKTYNQ